MAASQRIIAIDLGSSVLKVAEFTVQLEGLTLSRYAIQDLGMDPNKDEARFPFVIEGLAKALAAADIKPGPVNVAISGQFVFTKFLKLPPINASQMVQTIGYEAQNSLPFKIEEVVWDYQLLRTPQNETEAVIVAMKGDLLEEVHTILKNSKLRLNIVDVAPLSVVNAFLFNYADVTQPSLILDIGAKTTSVIFVEGQRFFARNVSIAGNYVTQTICNEFQEPFKAAELLKKGKGFVGLGGAYADPDDLGAARISKITRSVFSRLYAEVNRSVSFWRNQQGGSAPERIFLTGGSSAFPYADLFFADKLRAEVEYLNPLRAIHLDPSLGKDQVAQDSQNLAVVVGLGLRQLKDCPAEVNILPLSCEKERQSRNRTPILVAAVVLWLVGWSLMPISNFFEAQKVNQEVSVLEKDLRTKRKWTNQIRDLMQQTESVDAVLRSLEQLEEQRHSWPRILNAMAQSVPEKVWVTELRLLGEGGRPVERPTSTVAATRGAPRGSEQVTKTNFVDKVVGIRLQGFYEAANTSPTIGDNFRSNLMATDLFEDVQVEAEGAFGNPEDIGVPFVMFLKFKPETAPNLAP